jgi:hypothetical protein
MIAPAMAFALVQVFQQKTSRWMRVLVCASFAILLLGLMLNAFFSLKKTPWSMSVQPFGALLFAGYSIIWVFRSSLWEESREFSLDRSQISGK